MSYDPGKNGVAGDISICGGKNLFQLAPVYECMFAVVLDA
jgi:hypothetical protein